MRYTVAQIAAAMDSIFPPDTAEPWDKVGLVVGEPSERVDKIGFAVDPCQATINEAIERGAQMLITHHPLFLRGTSSVAAVNAKGKWVTAAIRAHLAIFAAHTNADVGASTLALANLVGMTIERPLDEETGIGGVGPLASPIRFPELVELFARQIPAVPAGVLGAGPAELMVERLAICSGSGDSLLQAANDAGADAYFTADLRHHPATDHLWDGGCALINATHWASEWPLLRLMEQELGEVLPGLETYVSTIPTDAWNMALRG